MFAPSTGMLQAFTIHLQTSTVPSASLGCLLTSMCCSNAGIHTWSDDSQSRRGAGACRRYVLAASYHKHFSLKYLCRHCIFIVGFHTCSPWAQCLFLGIACFFTRGTLCSFQFPQSIIFTTLSTSIFFFNEKFSACLLLSVRFHMVDNFQLEWRTAVKPPDQTSPTDTPKLFRQVHYCMY